MVIISCLDGTHTHTHRLCKEKARAIYIIGGEGVFSAIGPQKSPLGRWNYERKKKGFSPLGGVRGGTPLSTGAHWWGSPGAPRRGLRGPGQCPKADDFRAGRARCFRPSLFSRECLPMLGLPKTLLQLKFTLHIICFPLTPPLSDSICLWLLLP